MKLTVLGSGTAFSGWKRACSSYLVEGSKNCLVMDLGYGAFKNLQKAINPSRVNALLFTHLVHADHVLDLIAFIQHRNAFVAYRGGEKRQLNIIGPKGMLAFFKKVQQLFPDFSSLLFKVKVLEMDYGEKKLFEFKIKSKPVKHTGESIGYRIESGGRALAYSGDTGYCQEIIDLGKEADMLVLECTVIKKVADHLTPEQCGQVAAAAGAKQLLLTHFYPETEKIDSKKRAKKFFKGRVLAAQDLMQVSV